MRTLISQSKSLLETGPYTKKKKKKLSYSDLKLKVEEEEKLPDATSG